MCLCDAGVRTIRVMLSSIHRERTLVMSDMYIHAFATVGHRVPTHPHTSHTSHTSSEERHTYMRCPSSAIGSPHLFTPSTPPTPPPRSVIYTLSLIHISESTRLRRTSYPVFCLKKNQGYNRMICSTNAMVPSDGRADCLLPCNSILLNTGPSPRDRTSSLWPQSD